MALLGGPVCIILMGAFALYKWYHNADLAAGSTKRLTAQLNDLAAKYNSANKAQQAFIRSKLKGELYDVIAARRSARQKIKGLTGHQFTSLRAKLSQIAQGWSNLYAVLNGVDLGKKTAHDVMSLYRQMKMAEKQAGMLRKAIKNLGKPIAQS